MLRRLFGEEQVVKQFQNNGADIDWLFHDVFYGLLLSNNAVLSTVETQVMTCAALACEGSLFLRPLLILHLGGLRNLGVRLEEAEAVMACVEMVAKWAGKDTGSWMSVRELVSDWKFEEQATPNPFPVGGETAVDAGTSHE